MLKEFLRKHTTQEVTNKEKPNWLKVMIWTTLAIAMSMCLVSLVRCSKVVVLAETETEEQGSYNIDYYVSSMKMVCTNQYADYMKGLQYELINNPTYYSGGIYLYKVGTGWSYQAVNTRSQGVLLDYYLIWNVLATNSVNCLGLIAVDSGTDTALIYTNYATLSTQNYYNWLVYMTYNRNANNPRNYFAYDSRLVDSYPNSIFNPMSTTISTQYMMVQTTTPILTYAHNFGEIKHAYIKTNAVGMGIMEFFTSVGKIDGLGYGTSYQTFYLQGVQDVRDNPSKYNLHTSEEYESYGATQYSKGKNDAITTGEGLSTNWFIGIFTSISDIFALKLFGDITIGMIAVIPFGISFVWFLIRILRGGGSA